MAHNRLELDVLASLREAYSAAIDSIAEASLFIKFTNELIDSAPESTLLNNSALIRLALQSEDISSVGLIKDSVERQISQFKIHTSKYSLVAMFVAVEVYVQTLLAIASLMKSIDLKGGTITSDEYRSVVQKAQNRSRARLDRQLELVLAQLGCDDVLQPTQTWLPGFTSLRNCLVHRNGLVSKRDVLAEQTDLVVRWCKPIPSNQVELNERIVVHDSTRKLSLRHTKTTRWKVGERVLLDAEECEEIAGSLQLCCGQILDTVIPYFLSDESGMS